MQLAYSTVMTILSILAGGFALSAIKIMGNPALSPWTDPHGNVYVPWYVSAFSHPAMTLALTLLAIGSVILCMRGLLEMRRFERLLQLAITCLALYAVYNVVLADVHSLYIWRWL